MGGAELGQSVTRAASLAKSLWSAGASKDLALAYSRIWKDHTQAIASLKQKYAAEYAEIDRVTTGNEDFIFVAMMLSPGPTLAATILPKQPAAAFKIADTLLGGALTRRWQKESEHAKQDFNRHAHRTREEEGSMYDWFRKKFSSISDVLDDSQVGTQMRRDAQRAVDNNTKHIRELVIGVATATNIQMLMRALKSSRVIDTRQIVQALGDEANGQQVELSVLNGMKQSVKAYVLSQIAQHLQAARQSGQGTDSLYVKNYDKLYHDVKEIKI